MGEVFASNGKEENSALKLTYLALSEFAGCFQTCAFEDGVIRKFYTFARPRVISSKSESIRWKTSTYCNDFQYFQEIPHCTMTLKGLPFTDKPTPPVSSNFIFCFIPRLM